MFKLVRAEFFKLFHSAVFWLLLFFSLTMGGLRGLMAILRAGSVTGYEVFVMELTPDLIYAALICLFTASFVCEEFSNHTFGMSFLCGFSRWKVFWAKAMAFYAGLLPLVILPVVVTTTIAALGNGFGLAWDDGLALAVISRLLGYIFRYMFLGSFALLAASVVRDRIGTFGVALAGILILMFTTRSNLEMPETMWEFILASLAASAVLSVGAILFFVKNDLK